MSAARTESYSSPISPTRSPVLTSNSTTFPLAPPRPLDAVTLLARGGSETIRTALAVHLATKTVSKETQSAILQLVGAESPWNIPARAAIFGGSAINPQTRAAYGRLLVANNRGAAFQARYREVDILLIDDIQFLQGRAETQEAFFHTFNTLHDHNKQVVITSDVAPKLLTGFEDRMRSRFEWGLITDVQAPDLETRIAILRKKAQSESLHIPDEVLEYIATVVSSNIRELEGALTRVVAFSSLTDRPMTVELAEHVLKDVFPQGEAAPEVTIARIQEAVSQRFGVTHDELVSPRRSQAVAYPRQVAMYLSRELTDASLPKIGREFGGRDHTTVIHATTKITRLIREDRSVYNLVQELTARIKQVR